MKKILIAALTSPATKALIAKAADIVIQLLAQAILMAIIEASTIAKTKMIEGKEYPQIELKEEKECSTSA